MRVFIYLLLALSLTGCATLVTHPIQGSATPSPATSIAAPEPVVQLAMQSPPPLPVAVPFTNADVRCLADAMYYEARGEGDRGMAAVGYVVTNRVKLSKTFAPTICGVVYQGRRDHHGRLVRGACQFGWACDGRHHPVVNKRMYTHCQDLAKLVILNMAPNPIGHATHFHASSERVSKKQARTYASVMRVGHQVFYRPRGDQFNLALVTGS